MPLEDLPLKFTNALTEAIQMAGQPIDQLSKGQRQFVTSIFEQGRYARGDVTDALRNDQAKLAQPLI